MAVKEDFVEGAQFICVNHDAKEVVGTICECISITKHGTKEIALLLGNKGTTCKDINKLDNIHNIFVPLATITEGDILYAKLSGEWENVVFCYEGFQSGENN
jgi:hypothetical protein